MDERRAGKYVAEVARLWDVAGGIVQTLASSATISHENQTRRFFGGRQPLCGNGVTSSIALIEIPAFCKPVIALSRPDPGPFTRISISFTPIFATRSAQVSAARWAANGVLFRLPLNPLEPAVAQVRTSPFVSVIVTVVLLNVAFTCATARVTFRRTFFFAPFCFATLNSLTVLNKLYFRDEPLGASPRLSLEN